MGEAPAAEAPVAGTPRAMEGAATRNLQRAPAPFPPCGAGASAVDTVGAPPETAGGASSTCRGRRACYASDAITCLICV
jgi:hypothetical protein